MISATASRARILHATQVDAALAARRRRPMLLLDLAVPRDIDAGVAQLSDVFLYTVDDLERAIEDNRRSRREAADEAEAIVELQVARFREKLEASTRSEPVKRLRQAGVLELLLALANESEGATQPAVAAATTEKDLADMDLDDLLNAALMDDDE